MMSIAVEDWQMLQRAKVAHLQAVNIVFNPDGGCLRSSTILESDAEYVLEAL